MHRARPLGAGCCWWRSELERHSAFRAAPRTACMDIRVHRARVADARSDRRCRCWWICLPFFAESCWIAAESFETASTTEPVLRSTMCECVRRARLHLHAAYRVQDHGIRAFHSVALWVFVHFDNPVQTAASPALHAWRDSCRRCLPLLFGQFWVRYAPVGQSNSSGGVCSSTGIGSMGQAAASPSMQSSGIQISAPSTNSLSRSCISLDPQPASVEPTAAPTPDALAFKNLRRFQLANHDRWGRVAMRPTLQPSGRTTTGRPNVTPEYFAATAADAMARAEWIG